MMIDEQYILIDDDNEMRKRENTEENFPNRAVSTAPIGETNLQKEGDGDVA